MVPDATTDSAANADTQTMDLKSLRWRCRRGMRELDVVFERYLDQRYPQAPLAEQQAFVKLLGIEDPLIYGWLTGRGTPDDPELKSIVQFFTGSN